MNKDKLGRTKTTTVEQIIFSTNWILQMQQLVEGLLSVI